MNADNGPLTIIGAGSYASTIVELAESCGYSVDALLDDDPVKVGSDIDGIRVDGPIAAALERLPDGASVAVAIGHNDTRLKWLMECRHRGLTTPHLISPHAVVSPRADIGDAVYLHPGCHVWSHASLALGTILSPHATVAHHTSLAASCFVSSGANVGASITVGEASMFGMASAVSTGVRHVSPHTLVGAGAVVIRDTEPYGVYVGNPARLLRVQTP
ncbi:hypothetical protein GCM10025789_28630 [Tessaracoccus lubricantis]|uniref:PglD N-terminal domain-containing protein n=1 Tax=Tessaracoccus lubricantis TaxID=545543 RepID=A0ABP9FMK9_9ACTN